MKGGKSSELLTAATGFIIGGLLMELPTGKIGGLDEVPGLGVVALALVTTGKFVLIGGETCLLLMLADVRSEADEADDAVTEAVANAVIDAES